MKRTVTLTAATVIVSLGLASSASADQLGGWFTCVKNNESSGEWSAYAVPTRGFNIPVHFCGHTVYIDEGQRVNLLDRYCLGGNGVLRSTSGAELCRW